MSATTVTGKRKRADVPRNVQFKKSATQAAVNQAAKNPDSDEPKVNTTSIESKNDALNGGALGQTNGHAAGNIHLQVITGSYERVLHGICAAIPREALSKPEESDDVQNGTSSPSAATFSDTFLFAAHASSIRCLAVSPPTNNSKRTLATGGSDERVNLYSISTAPPKPTTTTTSSTSATKLPSLLATTTSQTTANRTLGTLLHHDRALTALHFPSASKLFSAAEDNTIAISRTRDWTMLSSIRAPIPKPQGRPSGDTADPGEVPAGVNSFAVHPSQKLMLSVGKGERCMRLWNLITGKKAGVLSFEREVLGQVGEGRLLGAGEGRKVLWDEGGECFVVGFERGAVVFGVDSKAKAVVRSQRPTKFHQMRFLPGSEEGRRVLAVSTEDGRVMFFDLSGLEGDVDASKLPQCPCLAQLGGSGAGIAGRIKDFEVLRTGGMFLVVTASSDGAVRVWSLKEDALDVAAGDEETVARQIGHLAGTLETSNRITCLAAFVMDGKAAGGANGSAVLRATEEDGVEENVSEEEDSE